jgi:deoxyhypusine synthase
MKVDITQKIFKKEHLTMDELYLPISKIKDPSNIVMVIKVYTPALEDELVDYTLCLYNFKNNRAISLDDVDENEEFVKVSYTCNITNLVLLERTSS